MIITKTPFRMSFFGGGTDFVEEGQLELAAKDANSSGASLTKTEAPTAGMQTGQAVLPSASASPAVVA